MKQIQCVKRNNYYIGNIMGELSEYAKRYIFKMVHVDNMEYVLSTGICAKHHPKAKSGMSLSAIPSWQQRVKTGKYPVIRRAY